MDLGRLVAGVGICVVGAALVYNNRRLGKSLRGFNSGHLIDPSRASAQYSEDRKGRVWMVLVVGIGWIVLGAVLILAALVGRE